MKRKRHAASSGQQLLIRGLSAAVEVRRHPTARRMTLRVSRTRRMVVVTLPLQCDLMEAGTFLETHIEWVREHLGSLPQPVPFRHGAVIPFRGQPHRLEFVGAGRGVVTQKQVFSGPPALVVSGAPEHAPRRLRDWLSEQALRDLDARVRWHARKLGLTPTRITIRDQTTRWGSCSTRGALSFSWRLVLAPNSVLDYVAAHEVAHLKEMNHGARFWALVRKTMPQMDEARRWLRTYGMDLHRYGAQP
jgi:predicted metal-dependent hydrolase